MKLLEQIKNEFGIKDFKTLTNTKWCEIKRLSEDMTLYRG